jgi:hypothetical protein
MLWLSEHTGHHTLCNMLHSLPSFWAHQLVVLCHGNLDTCLVLLHAHTTCALIQQSCITSCVSMSWCLRTLMGLHCVHDRLVLSLACSKSHMCLCVASTYLSPNSSSWTELLHSSSGSSPLVSKVDGKCCDGANTIMMMGLHATCIQGAVAKACAHICKAGLASNMA